MPFHLFNSLRRAAALDATLSLRSAASLLDEEALAEAHETLQAEGFQPEHVARIAARVVEEAASLAAALES